MSAPPSAPTVGRRFRWLQFSLRTLLLVILVAALGLAWYSRELRRRERIERAIELLAIAPSVYTIDYDPIALVRAVNGLHALGKEDAIVALRRFAEQYPRRGDHETSYMTLKLVIPLLFERADPEDEHPFVWISTRDDWSRFLYVHGDIPFRRGPVALLEPLDDNTHLITHLIDWAEAHARLRATPLRPADDPLAAADQAIEAWIVRRNLDGLSPLEDAQADSFDNAMRQKGLRCIAHLLKLPGDDLPYLGSRNDADWLRLKEECQRIGIRWSEEKQDYVATTRTE